MNRRNFTSPPSCSEAIDHIKEIPMTRERICLKRDELYEQVWSQPLIELAKRYGLSDVGLAKICRKLKIPLPGRGYWAKHKAGRIPPRPSLPALKKNDPTEVVVTKPEPPPAEPQALTEAERLIALETLPENLIVVSPMLSSPHPLVARTQALLRLAKPSDHGLLYPSGDDCLAVCVGRHSLARALRIMDALIKALEARGYTVTTEAGKGCTTTATVLSIPLEIELREQLSQVPHQLTASERADQKRTPWLTFHKYDHHLSGQLTLGIKNWCRGARRHWADGKKQRLEHCLNAVVAGLIQAAVRLQAWELERERQHRQWEEERRQLEEQERLEREEEARRQQLEREIADWQRAKQIRAYVEAVRQSAVERQGALEAGGDLDRWLVWAMQQADRIDPLSMPPEISVQRHLARHDPS
jgi:hypothetical protein